MTMASYGAWKSPISSDLIVAGAIGLGQIKLDDKTIYWSESRPTEGGRNVIIQYSANGQRVDVTPLPFNARTRVHEYGGGAFMVANGTVYFSNFADQRLYQQAVGSEPIALTPEAPLRYADTIIERTRNRLICVREEHQDQTVENTIAAVSLTDQSQTILVSGSDFYAFPRLSPDGSRLSWICWNHPNMPWDGTELWTAKIEADGTLETPEKIAGGLEESIFQPEWSPDGNLIFVSDRTGWWNFYRWNPTTQDTESLCEKAAEFGLPLWVFGMSTYGFAGNKIICSYTENGLSRFASLDLDTCELMPIETPYPSIAGLQVCSDHAVFVGGSSTEPTAIVKYDLHTQQFEVLRRASELQIDPGYLSVPEAIEFPTENNLTAHALYYAPKNKDYTAPEGERPPMLVKSHGGPTASTSAAFNLGIQYWTSRGFAVLDVNYGMDAPIENA